MHELRRARMSDVPHIQRLVNQFAERGELLPRSLNELYEHLRDYYVIEQDGTIVGCAACRLHWQDLAEVMSLVVAENCQGRGYGSQLLEACLREAQELGVSSIFALTYLPEFFQRYGFRTTDKATLPHKIWSDCIHCVKFPDCGEVALVKELT